MKYQRTRISFFDLLLNADVPTVILSGDIHYGQLLRATCVLDKVSEGAAKVQGEDYHARSSSLVEAVSSGMTHAWNDRGELWPYVIPYIHTAWLHAFVQIWNWIDPEGLNAEGTEPYYGLNFGELEIRDEGALGLSIAVRVRNETGAVAEQLVFGARKEHPDRRRGGGPSWTCQGSWLRGVWDRVLRMTSLAISWGALVGVLPAVAGWLLLRLG
eukprot:NODE_3988_length_882_cov_7.326531_g3676_i0.p1 GENE.NODE_3988_length_882_cov_7.326531_g3676_i0~~NODE_3988_length_882_cov_7.326531_g3676_i0.p1  ORF type:complete len:214 (+),score=34.78 NODE_3988_length_882_cov_7.326531_g3676_i0:174-815(+)